MMTGKQKTCLGFWEEDAIDTGCESYDVNLTVAFQAVPKEEYDKLKKELKETEDDRDYFESESETYDCDELEDEIEELQKNSIPKEEVRKVLNEELRYGEKVYTFGEYLDGCVETIERIKKQLLGEK